MSLVAAAFCPHPPLLVPELAGGAAPELDQLRLAGTAAIRVLAEARPERLMLVGGAEVAASYAGGRASFAGYGRDVAVGSGQPLPLSLAAGAYLLALAGWATPWRAATVAFEAGAGDCAALGHSLVSGPGRVALLALGDGPARLGADPPGGFDARGDAFWRRVVELVATGDPTGLLGLDAGLARELMAAGRAAWQVLAGAASGSRWSAEVGYDAAPYGVAYLVATWLPG